MDILPNQQYRIKCNHSGKITLRNRQFIKLIEQQTPSPTMSPGNNNVKPHQDVSPQQNNLHQPEINLPNDITKSNTEITPPTLQIPKRIPRALQCLADFNNPGLNE